MKDKNKEQVNYFFQVIGDKRFLQYKIPQLVICLSKHFPSF